MSTTNQNQTGVELGHDHPDRLDPGRRVEAPGDLANAQRPLEAAHDELRHPRPLRALAARYLLRKPAIVLHLVVAGLFASALPLAAAATGAILTGHAATGEADLARWSWLLAGIAVAAAVAAWWQSWIGHDWAFAILRDIRTELFDGLERATPGRLLGRRTGDLSAAATADVNTTEMFFAHTAADYLGAILVSLGAVAAVGLLDPPTAAVTLLVMLLVAAVPYVLAARAGAEGRRLRAELGVLNAEAVDGVQGLRELAVFGRTTQYLDKLGRRTDDYHRSQARYASRSALEQAGSELVLGLGALAILTVAARQVLAGQAPGVDLALLVVLAVASLAPIALVSGTARSLGDVRAAADRVLTVVEYPAQVADTGRRSLVSAGPPEVTFDEVRFRYAADRDEVLSGVSFRIQPGETVALVGASGAGKSTCVNLLLRFWDPAAGEIRIDGRPLPEIPIADLRSAVAVIPQETYLFHSTIADNLRLGRPDATDAELQEAAELAGVHQLITELPGGYDTMCGERGLTLSGGQRQRLAIARALVTKAPVLIWDEAVANLDSESEQAVNAAMASIKSGHTMLVVAHRLSTIRTADRVIMLADGKVVADGRHDDLLAGSPEYRRLLADQQYRVVT